MPTAVVTSLVKKIQQLSPREQQELRTALGTLLSPTPALTEEDLHRRLAAQGRLSVPSPAAALPFGTPLVQTRAGAGPAGLRNDHGGAALSGGVLPR